MPFYFCVFKINERKFYPQTDIKENKRYIWNRKMIHGVKWLIKSNDLFVVFVFRLVVVLFDLFVFILIIVAFLVFGWLSSFCLDLVLGNGQFLDVDDDLRNDKPHEPAELAFRVDFALFLNTVLHLRPYFLQLIRQNRKFQLISKLVHIRANVIKYGPTFDDFGECLLMFKILFFYLQVGIFVLGKTIKE